jgi:hypothetical protein
MSLFNWYILNDGLLCGDLCLHTMRHDEYILEKNSYKDPEFILKKDKKYKKTFPNANRFHIFVKVTIVSIVNNIATVIYEKKEKNIILQNLETFFYLNDIKKNKITEIVKSYG